MNLSNYHRPDWFALTHTIELIEEENQANDIIYKGDSDLFIIVCEMLHDKYFGIKTSINLVINQTIPEYNKRAF